MKGEDFANAIDMVLTVSHAKIHKVKEVYLDKNTVYLVSDSLRGSYKNLIEFDTILEDLALTMLLKEIVLVLRHLASLNITM